MISSFSTTRRLQIFLIVIVCVLAYSNSINCPFTFDDAALEQYKTFRIDEQSLINSLISVLWSQRYLPVASFALNYKLHGFKPLGYHIVNLLIHVLTALFLYWFVLFTLKSPKLKDIFNENTEPLAAFFTAALFAVHPMSVMSVTFVIQRFTSLAAMFYMLTMVLYAKSRIESDKGGKATRYYIFSVCAALISTRTKEIVVTLPVIIFFYEYMFFKDSFKKKLIRSLPFFIIIPIVLNTSFKQGLLNTVGFMNAWRVASVTKSVEKPQKGRRVTLRQNKEAVEALKEGPAEAMKVRTWKEHALTQLRVTCSYMRMLVLPYKLAPIYFYPASRTFWEPAVLTSLSFLIFIVFASVFLFFRYKQSDTAMCAVSLLVPFGMFWFLLNILPQSAVRPADNWEIFDYRTYLPSTGFIFACVTMVFYVFGEKRKKHAAILLTFVLITFAILTYKRNSYWVTEESLWQENIKNYPLNPIPHINLANAYLSMENYDKALKEFRVALEMDPFKVEVYNNIGSIYIKLGDKDKAEEEFRKALRVNPTFAVAHHNLGNLYLDKGLDDKALLEYSLEASFDLHPADAYMGMAGIYLKKGQLNEALENYKVVINNRNDFPEAHFSLGIVYDRLGNVDEALKEFQIALKQRPGYISAHMNIGNIYLRQGFFGDAMRQFQKVLSLKPDNAEAHAGLANVYADAGQLESAINEYLKAIELSPDVSEFHNNLGTVYQTKGLFKQAALEYRRALSIEPKNVNAGENLKSLPESFRNNTAETR
ncbi:tetratricopeptide repeat protein [Candidatus Magnetomonas plexicatena]|uniref:tetratricopeptide repeat protein n=1 Tax=Candidatus Magnetomonas plexicatena TaxID=2552947 RepID=UPI00110177D7|nr:tetratricopeptide repeat protein [Nitrospirales bacterium LBB_01]